MEPVWVNGVSYIDIFSWAYDGHFVGLSPFAVHVGGAIIKTSIFILHLPIWDDLARILLSWGALSYMPTQSPQQTYISPECNPLIREGVKDGFTKAPIKFTQMGLTRAQLLGTVSGTSHTHASLMMIGKRIETGM